MSAARKFLFETRFDAPRPVARPPEPEEENLEEEEEEAAPTFSDEDMAEARQEGFNAGKDEGIREAAEATERQIADTLAAIGGRMTALFEAQEKAAEALHVNGIAVIQALARKVLPEMSARQGTGEIERLARSVLERLRTEPRIVFTVHDSLAERLGEQLPAQAASLGCTGGIEVIGDAAVAPGDCRIEWADGGAERNTAALMAEIGDIIERNGGPAPTEGMPDETPNEISEAAETDGPEATERDLVTGESNG